MYSPIDVRRIGSLSYEIKFSDKDHKPVLLKFKEGNVQSSIDDNHEFFYNFAFQIGLDIASDKNLAAYNLGEREWEICEEKKSTPLLYRVTGFVHPQGDDGIKRFVVSRTASPQGASSILSSHEDFQLGAVLLEMEREEDDQYNEKELKKYNKKFRKNIKRNDFDRTPAMVPCSKAERAAKVRAKQRCPELRLRDELTTSIFSSPFTNLSTIAFQRYETEFAGSDGFKPEDCRYCLQLKEGVLSLLPNSHAAQQAKEVNRHTVQFFREQIITQYGKEKFDYICHLYQMDFDELLQSGKPLTPEHVYRMNIGLNNIESDQVESFFLRLPELLHVAQESFLKDHNLPLMDFLETLENSPLKISEMRGLIQAMQEKYGDEALTIKHLLRWLHPLCSYQNMEEVPGKRIAQMMEVFTPSESDYRRLFTGREIYFAMRSGYTTAGKEQFKPWIDQQQLLQVFPKIQNTNNWKNYYEKLSHTVCKYHLFREHPTLGCKVGAMIPGPLNELGERRWYYVKQAVHNGYGKICYTLSPLGNDTTLPTIKLYRSTATSQYAIFGRKTVRSDTNLLNTAGYEGKERTDHYENNLIHEQTIPVWVAYHTQGKNRLKTQDFQSAYASLHIANQELTLSELAKHRVLSLKEVVQKHDGILNTLYFLGKIDAGLYHRMRTVHYDQTFPATMPPSEKEKYYDEERGDAIKLTDQVLKYKLELRKAEKVDNRALTTQLDIEMSQLNDDLMAHVITPLAEQKREEHMIAVEHRILDQTRELDLAAINALEAGHAEEAQDALQEWADALERFAVETGESLDSKTPRDIAFAGHSLGGALAQIFTCHHLIEQRRAPCPGTKCSTIAFDAPGLRKEDNEKFKQFVADHHSLLDDLNIQFEIYHQHEANDPVPALGNHLGSANDTNEAAFLLTHVEFKLEVYNRLPNATNPAIAQAETAHATQFLEGIEGIDYEKKSLDPLDLGLMENCEKIRGLPPGRAVEEGKERREKDWQLPLNPGWVNWLQSNSLINNSAYYFSDPTWIEQDARMVPYLDKEGILFVES